MKTYKTFIKNNCTVLIGHALIYGQGIILMPIIIKSAGIAVYGGYILFLGMFGFIYGISSFGVGFMSGRFLPATEGRDARRALFYPQFCFQFLSIALLSMAFILFYPLIEHHLFKGELVFSKWLVFPYLFFYVLYSQTSSYFLSTHRFNHFNYTATILPYINIALIILIYLVTHNLSVNLLFSTQILSYIFVAVPLTVMLIREIGLKCTLPDLKNLIDDVKLGIPLRLNYVMDTILSSSDKYLITYFITVAAVGYYSPGFALGSLIIFFPRATGVALLPLLSKAIDTGKEMEAYIMLNYVIKGFLLLVIPFIVGGAVLSGPLLNLFANSEVAQKSYMVTPVIAVATLFFGLNIILTNVLWIRMKTSIIFKMNMSAAIISLTLNLIFLYIFRNVLVAAITTLISYLIIFIFIRRAVIVDWPLHFELRTIMKSIVASIVMGVAMSLLFHSWSSSHAVIHILATVGVGVIVYIIMLIILKVLSAKEINFLNKCIRNRAEASALA